MVLASAVMVLFSVAPAQAVELMGPRFPYSEFAALPKVPLAAGGTRLLVAFAPGVPAARQVTLLAWAQRAGDAVGTYFGRLPVAAVRVLFVPMPGAGVYGTTWGYRGAATRVTPGEALGDTALLQSWVMAHELVHVAVPQLPDANDWFSEGLATYVEPVARAQAGDLPVEQVWQWLADGLPKGLPREGDRGLDRTPTWGRRYWGGALFCLLADVEIRERTGNEKGLQDALRSLAAAGASNESPWGLERIFQVADRGVGVPVLSELYQRHRAAAVSVDLPQLFARLGVQVNGDQVRFDDAAPQAAIRQAITRRR